MPAIAAIDNETLDHLAMNVDECERTLATRFRRSILHKVIRAFSPAFAGFQYILCPRRVPGALQRPGGAKFRGAFAETAYRRIRTLTARASGGQARDCRFALCGPRAADYGDRCSIMVLPIPRQGSRAPDAVDDRPLSGGVIDGRSIPGRCHAPRGCRRW